MHLTSKMAAAAAVAAACGFGWRASVSAAQGVTYYGTAQPPTGVQPAAPAVRQQYPAYLYPTTIPRVYVNPAPFGSTYLPWHFEHEHEHYHIRDWTTGIEKPSYEVSKPWLNVHQYP